MKFNELPIPPPILAGINLAGFTECTPIQASILPISLNGKDVAGQAQTGTGKTAAFLITLFARLLDSGSCQDKPGHCNPRALILAPTRELVVQIEKDAALLGSQCGLVIQAVYGGIDYMKQKNALKEGVDIVIGTPGRLIDYLKQKVYSLKQIELLVIDEADRMFDMGFIPDLRYILRRLPPFDKRQNLMFSATLNQRVMELSYEFMNLPRKVSVTPDKVTADLVEQQLYHLAADEKLPLLLGLLRQGGMERTIIFANTKREVEKLQRTLDANGFPCRVISGDVEQRKRMSILEQFKTGKLSVLVATDVASRGLHIEAVTHVINYDLPQDAEDYVHRIGRTARAGAGGVAISFADEDGAFYIETIEEYLKCKLPVQWADDQLFVTDFIKPARKKEPHKQPLPKKGCKTSPAPASKTKKAHDNALVAENRAVKKKRVRKPRKKTGLPVKTETVL